MTYAIEKLIQQRKLCIKKISDLEQDNNVFRLLYTNMLHLEETNQFYAWDSHMNRPKNIQAVILAAGSSSRFKTGTSKLLVPLCGQQLILYPINVVEKLNLPTTIVIGHNKEEIQQSVKQHKTSNNISFVEQKEQRGTGDAFLCSSAQWRSDHILVLNGDMPLITSDIIQSLIEKHVETDSAISFATAHFPEPGGYGRVIRKNGKIEIIENRDFTGDVSVDCCINAGLYLFKKSFVQEAIRNLQPHGNSNEFYITDLIKIASDNGLGVETIQVAFDTIRGINTLKELWACEQIKRGQLMSYWMDEGVRFPMAHKVHIEIDVEIGAGTIIESGVQLLKGTKIGKNSCVGPYSVIDSCIIGDKVEIKSHTVIKDSIIKSGACVGPFAHIHDSSVIEEEAVVGSFVEVVRSTIGAKTKAKHLAYLGDTTTGTQSNIGAGTVVCNYNGVRKEKTTIGSEVFIGGNNSIIAPVTIGDRAMTAAGSTIHQDVPGEALAIARARQENKEGYAPKLLKKYKDKKAEKKLDTSALQETTTS